MRFSNVTIVTAVAALLGGVLAIVVTSVADVDVDFAVWLLLLVGATVVASAVAILTLTSAPAPQAPPQQPPARNDWHQRLPHQQEPAAAPRQRATVPRAAEPQATPGVQVVPLEESARPGEWWNRSGPARAAAPDQHLPAPELASYVASGAAFVAQCPNCGDFRIDVSRGDPAHSFQCRNPDCGAHWRWTPGTDWPPVVVRRNLTARRSGPDHR